MADDRPGSHARPAGHDLASFFGVLEARVLEALWQRNGPASVRDLQPDFPDAAYTTLMTTLDRLHRKGVLERVKEGRAFRYRPRYTSEELRARLAGDALRRLREDFETWRNRDLADEDIRHLFMDGWYPKVRIGGRRTRVPVLVTRDVRATGERVVLDVRVVGDESAASWTEGVARLTARHLARPAWAVIDGNPRLITALRSHWPGIAIQHCTAHTRRTLPSKVPAWLREELTEDYRPMIYGETRAAVEQERARFTRK